MAYADKFAMATASADALNPEYPSPRASNQLKRGPGRDHELLSSTERHRLAEILSWAEQHKSEATFKSLYVNDTPNGSYGQWTWQRPCGKLVLTALVRGSMVEFVRESDSAAELGFVWNNILKELNDVALPVNVGRGYFRAVLGLSISKTARERRKQERRIAFQKLGRLMRRVTSRKPRSI